MTEPAEKLRKISSLEEILQLAVKAGASDIHLKAGIVPVIRKHGQLRPLAAGIEPLTAQEIDKMAFQIMDNDMRDHFKKFKEVDLGHGVKDLGRFRVNIFQQRGSVRMVMRTIPSKIPNLDDLGLPSVVQEIANNERGLILVTGVTGSGKSTTLAAMIDWINHNKNRHILTIEDPIEYLIRDRKSIISQRELGFDTTSFGRALKAGLRQDPDVILIGEMRDEETINIALEAAETGHLVLSTLHTLDASETINRIITNFEPFKQLQVRRQLAAVLKACISQRLARRKDKSGFIPATEILINSSRVKDLIEDPTRTKEIFSAIEQGRSSQMQTFEQSLLKLVRDETIDYEEGLRLANNPEDFALKFAGIGAGQEWGSPFSQEEETSSHQPSSLQIEKASGSSYNQGHGKPPPPPKVSPFPKKKS